MNDVTIKHDAEFQRFVVAMDGNEAELTYTPVDDSTLEYDHTYVPDVFRGRGIGARLVKHALEYARENGYTVVPKCPFVSEFVNRKPEYADVLAEE
jgi:hypothetical protein